MNDPMFLTEDELVELTGYRQPSKQIVHLRAQRIPFHPNKAGHPRVTRAAVEGRKVASAPAQASKTTWSPSWGASAASI